MTENNSENRPSLINRIRGRFFRPDQILATHNNMFGQIRDKYHKGLFRRVESRNEAFSVFSQMIGEVVGVSSGAMVETMRGLSREIAEVAIEKLTEEAQAKYVQSQASGKVKEIVASEVHVRIAIGARAKFEEIADQFPSAVAYFNDLSPEERLQELNILVRQAESFKAISDRTKKQEDVVNTRISSKVVEAARSLIAAKDSGQSKNL